MSYEIRRGWPSNGALDEVLMAADGATLTDGTVAVLDSATGKWKTGALAADDAARKAPLHAFVIAKEDLRHTYVGLMSDAVIEVDKDHYVGSTFASNDPLGVDESTGKFKAAVVGTDVVVGKVIYFDASNGHMRLFWKPMADA